MNENTFTSSWPTPQVAVDDHYGEGQQATITYQRADGENATVRVFEDGEGRIVVIVFGTAGADIEVVEDDESAAAITVNDFTCPPHTETDISEKDRIHSCAQASGWVLWPSDQWWHYRRGEVSITAQYSPRGRLIYGARAQTDTVEFLSFVGADRADLFINELKATPSDG